MVDIKWDEGDGGKEKELNDRGEMHEGGGLKQIKGGGLKQIKGGRLKQIKGGGLKQVKGGGLKQTGLNVTSHISMGIQRYP